MDPPGVPAPPDRGSPPDGSGTMQSPSVHRSHCKSVHISTDHQYTLVHTSTHHPSPSVHKSQCKSVHINTDHQYTLVHTGTHHQSPLDVSEAGTRRRSAPGPGSPRPRLLVPLPRLTDGLPSPCPAWVPAPPGFLPQIHRVTANQYTSVLIISTH